jgi:alpha-galactosidase
MIKMFTEKDGAEPESLIVNIADFEREYATYNILENFKTIADFNADIIILAIGENVPDIATDEDKSAFSDAISKLLEFLKKNDTSPALFIRSSFWSNPTKDAILQQTSINTGGIFVDISNLDKNEANYARSERDYDHGGVAAHPGDAGMVAIADAIWNAVQKENLC